MKVLFAVSECVPFIKSGGLADVAGSLPKELKKMGTDVRVILPKYGLIPEKFRSEMKKVTEFTVQLGWRSQYCGIETLEHDGVTFYFVDNEYYFKRDSLYGHYDDGERFSFFSRAVLEFIAESEFYPDVIHCHDWHTGMIPFLLRTEYYKRPGYGLIRSVFTIHNLQFQGIFPQEVLGDLLQIESSYFNEEQLEFYGMANFMKAALISADHITTVSPTYKDEIQTEYFGEKLDGILRKRKEDLSGILNGIDHVAYDPESDPGLAASFGVWGLERRVINKLQVQRSFGLPVNDDVPVVAMITRLTKQKGLDLVRKVFHEILATGLQLVVLGTGDPEFEHFFRDMAVQYPDQCGVYIGFDENLAHQVYAGSDLFLMPSKFEPCGLSQMIAMRYGSIPVVRETGGLNDTVQPYNEFNGQGNGFTFANFNAHDMLFTIERALSFYHQREKWLQLMATAMETDYSWAQSARQYKDLYSDLISRSESHVF
ncbi:glycogen synthase GlgA [Bacillus sp. ISL-35]|uniref:glycogen synthase GlgA n=1 Tax=Bacillus sp. ISL-35 TaxID=2819122 RepID=UPI001BEB2D92|nr:glycogen synthase GlgA [Bacillus sp. ISL-35]MBT2705633.1 glycogen synthase GlgA [Chryseobacterium sp. ISL-80]